MPIWRSTGVLVMAVAVTACHPKSLRHAAGIGYASRPLIVDSTLRCPDQVGSLTRTAQAADGRSCAYSGHHQEVVELSYLPLAGDTAGARLAGLGQTLSLELPKARMGPADGAGASVVDADDGGNAHIDLPGFHLNASDGKATIQMPGVSINADGDDAKVTTGPQGKEASVVTAHPGGSEIRIGGVNANGADMTDILAADQPGPTGFRVVGYMAKGPTTGPLVVGVFRVREHDHGRNDISNLGVNRLIDLNVRARE